jgi:hypothetical protein
MTHNVWEEEEVVVIMGPTLLWEIQTPSLFDGRWGVFLCLPKKKESYWGAAGAIKLSHLA